MTEEEFRSDKATVGALANFLNSKEGAKFKALMECESPLSKLASRETQQPANVRDLAIAEQGSADNLLGKCVGWDLLRNVISRCSTMVSKAPQKEPRAARVSKIMQAGEK